MHNHEPQRDELKEILNDKLEKFAESKTPTAQYGHKLIVDEFLHEEKSLYDQIRQSKNSDEVKFEEMLRVRVYRQLGPV